MRSKIYTSLFVACLIFMTSCGKSSADLTNFSEFIKHNTTEKQSSLSETVSLYVDYSTCVAEAKNSRYFKATHPSIVDCSPVFYSIKGSVIKKETDNRQTVYNLLSDIHEVNHADIKSAVGQIVNANNQAVIITDGEYYMQGSVRDNLNNPYLAEEFRTWINKGYDIYFYCEPYLESKKFNKYRYYILFTDDDIYDNINDRFSRSCSAEDYGVTVFHLSDGQLRVNMDENYPVINATVSPSEENTKIENGIDVQEYYTKWKDMTNYMTEGDINQTYILRGLYVNNEESSSYKITKIKPVVYQLYPEYEAFCNSKYLGEELPKAGKFKQVKNVFEIDEDIFEETGEIVLKLKEGFDGAGDLSYDHPNLLKVDFVVTDAENNFTRNEDVNSAFIWKSISAAQNHSENTSLYESISLVLQNPKLNPKKREVVLYTVYISTYGL